MGSVAVLEAAISLLLEANRLPWLRSSAVKASHGGPVADLHITEETEPIDADLGSVARGDLGLAVPEHTEPTAGDPAARWDTHDCVPSWRGRP
jgi:hypothetical protein